MITRDEMIDDVIKTLGHENEWTIWFCELSEILSESNLRKAFYALWALIDNYGLECVRTWYAVEETDSDEWDMK